MKLLAPFVEFLDGEMPPGLGVGPFFVRLKINGSCEVGTRHRISSFISQPLADPQCRPCRSLTVQEGCSLTTSVPSCLGWRQAHTAHTHNLHAQLDTHTHTHLWCWLLSLELRGVPKSQVELFFFFFLHLHILGARWQMQIHFNKTETSIQRQTAIHASDSIFSPGATAATWYLLKSPFSASPLRTDWEVALFFFCKLHTEGSPSSPERRSPSVTVSFGDDWPTEAKAENVSKNKQYLQRALCVSLFCTPLAS